MYFRPLTCDECQRTLADYRDIMEASDLKYPPQLNEYEFNPFLLFDPKFQELRAFEQKHGIVAMSTCLLPGSSTGG